MSKYQDAPFGSLAIVAEEGGAAVETLEYVSDARILQGEEYLLRTR
jgi:hypothetical protein